MKKALFATSALVAAGLATSASAAEWSTSVTGYWFVGLAYADNDNGVGVLRDGEIHFRARLDADNGLTFQSRVELESFSSGGANPDPIDENWASVGGSFGTIKIGGDDDIVYGGHVGVIYAPGARIAYYDNFSLNPTTPFLAHSIGADSLGIHYSSPSFAGFSVGATYIPDIGRDGQVGADSNSPVFEAENQVGFLASYNGDFDGFGVAASAGYTDASGISDILTFGLNMSAAGFTVAGTYEDDGTQEFAVGAQYSAGPMTIAGGYAHDSGGAGTDIAAGWLTYALAPGVLGTVGAEYSDNAAGVDALGAIAFLTLNF